MKQYRANNKTVDDRKRKRTQMKKYRASKTSKATAENKATKKCINEKLQSKTERHLLKCHYDQKIISFFPSDFESVFA